MMKLHGFSMSPNTRRALLGLEEAGVAYEFVPVDLMSGAQRGPDYQSLNPTARVPTLVDGDYRLWESNAILEYLAEKAKEKELGPKGARERGEISRWMYMNAAHLSPAVAHVFAHTMRLPEEQRIPRLVEIARGEIDRSLRPLDAHLAGREFFLDRFTITDIAIAPTLAFAPMLGIDLGGYPNVGAWLARTSARPAWKKIYG